MNPSRVATWQPRTTTRDAQPFRNFRKVFQRVENSGFVLAALGVAHRFLNPHAG